jgi:uncharacterized protein
MRWRTAASRVGHLEDHAAPMRPRIGVEDPGSGRASSNIGRSHRLTSAALPSFLARSKGLIINISSIAALSPELFNGVYSGTKALVVNFTQFIHKELKDKGIQAQTVLPGATAAEFWDRAKFPVHNFPGEFVMTAEEMVDASLAGLDQGQLITIPALPNLGDWEKFEEARKAFGSHLTRQHSAARYGISASHKSGTKGADNIIACTR